MHLNRNITDEFQVPESEVYAYTSTVFGARCLYGLYVFMCVVI